MRTVVISQPMYFPWPGMLEQMRLADVFVYYDDVQMPQGRHFISRVQIKTAQGIHWLSVPLQREGVQRILDVKVDDSQSWRKDHWETLRHHYTGTPEGAWMLDVARLVLACPSPFLVDINMASMQALADCFGITPKTVRSSELDIEGSSSARLLAIVRHLDGTRYVTGHGARNYLDHALFEAAGIAVEYMQYQCRPYSQRHGAFTPYVSSLDLLAHRGPSGRDLLISGTVPWKEFCA